MSLGLSRAFSQESYTLEKMEEFWQRVVRGQGLREAPGSSQELFWTKVGIPC